MSRWFRSYADTHRNPKVARLSDADFRLWHQLLCIAAEKDGHIPPAIDLKNLLNRRLDHLLSGLKRLVDGSLIDPLDDGFVPRNWDERQYKSDTSTPRVHKHRAKRNAERNVSVTPPDTEADTEKVIPLAKANGPADAETIFWSNAKAYLRPYVGGDPGALIGKWLRDRGKEMTIAAINAAQIERAVDPLAYIPGFFRRHGAKADDYNPDRITV